MSRPNPRFVCPSCKAELPDRPHFDTRRMAMTIGLPPCECGDTMEMLERGSAEPQHFRVVQLGPGRRAKA